MAGKFIIGIDEVGRGALAGPVFVAVARVPRKLKIRNKKLGKLKDSKKLTAKKREEWFKFFKNHPRVNYELARVYPRKIEKINISQAANLAATRAFHRLTKSYKLKPKSYSIFLDGGLYLKNGKKSAGQKIKSKTIIKGDEKITAIKIASIIAKVFRDRFMEKLAREYPAYGFEIHKGYGTRLHREAIKKYGPSEVHRLTFIEKLLN